MHLTHVPPIGSIRDRGGLSSQSGRTRASVRYRGGLPRLSDVAAAERLSLSRCGSDQFWPQRITLLQCVRCDYQSSVIAGTLLQDTHTPLTLWFGAIWYVTSQKNGASALGVQRILGLGSYRTAWAWLHKLRRAMVRPGRDRRQGRVEVEATFVGGEEDGVRGPRRGDKSLVVIAVEVEGKSIGRIRLRSIPDASAASLHSFIADSVEPGSTLHTDGWPGYKGLEQKGYLCETSVIGKQP